MAAGARVAPQTLAILLCVRPVYQETGLTWELLVVDTEVNDLPAGICIDKDQVQSGICTFPPQCLVSGKDLTSSAQQCLRSLWARWVEGVGVLPSMLSMAASTVDNGLFTTSTTLLVAVLSLDSGFLDGLGCPVDEALWQSADELRSEGDHTAARLLDTATKAFKPSTADEDATYVELCSFARRALLHRVFNALLRHSPDDVDDAGDDDDDVDGADDDSHDSASGGGHRGAGSNDKSERDEDPPCKDGPAPASDGPPTQGGESHGAPEGTQAPECNRYDEHFECPRIGYSCSGGSVRCTPSRRSRVLRAALYAAQC